MKCPRCNSQTYKLAYRHSSNGESQRTVITPRYCPYCPAILDGEGLHQVLRATGEGYEVV